MLGDQRSNISPRSQLCASQSYCKQLRQLSFERTSWSWLSPTRAPRLAASKTESCFWLLSLSFYFPSSRRSNQETIQRSIPSDEWTESLILSKQSVIFCTFTQFFSLCFLWICYNSFCFPQKDLFRIDRCRVATTTEVGGQLKLERRWIFQRWISVGWPLVGWPARCALPAVRAPLLGARVQGWDLSVNLVKVWGYLTF